MKKRLLAGFLALVMGLGLLPMSALAARIDTSALPMEAPAGEAQRPSLPSWEDAPTQAELAEVDTEGLVNVANACAITVPSSQNDSRSPDKMVDGNLTSMWVNNGPNWPAVVTFALPRDLAVKKIELDFEHDNSFPNRAMTIELSAASSTSALSEISPSQRHTMMNTLTFSSSEGQTMNQLQITLSGPTNDGTGTDQAGFYPAIAEVKIWVDPLDLSTFANLAAGKSPTIDNTGANAAILTDGNYDVDIAVQDNATPTNAPNGPDDANFPKVDFDLGKNFSVAGFEFAVKPSADRHYFSYDIYAKADGATKWTTYATNVRISHVTGENIQQFPLGALADIRHVRFVLHSGRNASDGLDGVVAWPCPSEIKIFGVEPPRLVDLAPRSTISVPSSEGDKSPEKMVDGKLDSLWVNNGATWPCEIMFALPGNAKVKRIEVNFENFNNRSMRVTLNSAFNSVTSDMETILGPTQHTMSDTLIFNSTEEQGKLMSHVQIVLDNPLTDGAAGKFWPGIAEVKIWAVDETIKLTDHANITDKATFSQEGNSKIWDFKSNQQIAGFQVTLPEGVTGVLEGRLKRDKTWKTYIQALGSGDNVLPYMTGMAAVRVTLSAPDQLTDFQIWGDYVAPSTDPDNAAFDKTTHSNFNDAGTYLANDGNTATGWQADMYPAYLDIDLEENYSISEIEVYTPTKGYSQYTVYTSMDGQNFDLVADRSKNQVPFGEGKDVITLDSPKEARVVRVYMEYYSANKSPILNEVRVKGTPTNSAVQTAPAVTVADFETTQYAAAITDEETINAVKGIIERQVGAAYVDWFTFALAEGTSPADSDVKYDYFTLSDEGGKIKVTGNNGVSLATGVNHYLKYFCNVNISQVGKQVAMPASIPAIGATPVHKETKFPVRYAYNYCTHSYTMSFWNDEEWQNELDWLALNGVNVVLDITGQEEVWREFLMSVGYTHQEAKDFLAGPGYYAWAYMANLTGFGGPIHDSFLTQRVELARKNQRFMRVLGMEPVLQAFSGMVPTGLLSHDPTAQIIPQGVWCDFRRPDMLRTDTTTYDEYAAKFYAAQKRVLGDAKYYATDPFHEGGKRPSDLKDVAIASALLDSLIEFDPDAIWVIQSWQGNPSAGLLEGLRDGTNPTRNDRRDHALILDLWAEHSPHNNEQTYDGNGNLASYGPDTDNDGRIEFADTPWVWCMLNNFGGRMGLHGHLDSLQKHLPADANASKHMVGIGMSPEGAQENPVLYDFLFETVWVDDASQALPVIDLDQWLEDYATRRYGAASNSAHRALLILADTVYKDSFNRTGQGSPESVVNGRPSLTGGKASTWGNGVIAYSKVKLENALKLLLADYDTLSASDAYLYDVADVLKQQLSNYADNLQKEMAAAYRAGNASAFDTLSTRFLELIDVIDQVLATRSEFTFGKWTGGAVKMAEHADDFTKRLYLRNSKALVTTWGSIQQCETGGLKDYSNRQWAGLTQDFYKARWTWWINEAKTQLANATTTENGPTRDWFPWEWEFARDQKTYSSTPSGDDLQELAAQVLANYSVLEPLGDKDLDPGNMSVKTGSEETTEEPDDAVNALDRDEGTIWHTKWGTNVPDADHRWIAFDLGDTYAIDGLRYLPRQSSNPGRITGYEIYSSCDDAAWSALTDGGAWTASDAWTKVTDSATSGAWADNISWKEASFSAARAKYVVLKVTGSTAGYCSAAEIRITGQPLFPVTPATVERGTIAVQALVNGVPTALNDGTAVAGSTLQVTGESTGFALMGVTVARTGGAQEGDEAIAVTSAEAENGLYAYTFTMPAYPVTVTGVFKTKVTAPTVAAEGNIFRVGKTLTATIGAGESVTYQWYRHEANGGNHVAIPDATSSTYTLVSADSGKTVTVKVTGTGTYGGWAESAPTATIQDAAKPADSVTFARGQGGITMWLNDASKNTDQPVAEVGSTTTVTATANGTPTQPLTVSWAIKADAPTDVITFTDANSLQLPITAAKVGSTILVCSVTAADTDTPVTGEIAITVKAKPERVIVKKGGAEIGSAPIVIWTNEGDTSYPHSVDLTAEVSPAAAENQNINWNRAQIEGLVTLARTDETHGQSATITAMSDRAKTGSVTVIVSAAADPTVKKEFTVQIKTHVTNQPTISGTAKVGQTLTAQISNIQMVDSAKNALKYQWFRADDASGTNKTAVDAANASPTAANTSYTLTAADYGKYIFVAITSDDTYYDCQGVSSAASAQVAEQDGPAAPTGLAGEACATAANTDGKITGLESGKTYELHKETETEGVWGDVTSQTADATGALTNLAKGNYQVRIPADAVNHVAASEWSSPVTIGGFQETLYTITCQTVTGGKVETHRTAVAEGATVTVTLTPDAAHGYELVPNSLTVTDADDSPVPVNGVTFTMPAKNVTITAQFQLKKITISHTFGNMKCSLADQATNSHQVNWGTVTTITLTPDEGYKVPATITVKKTGEADAQGSDFYTYRYDTDRASATITFTKGVTENITITGDAERKTYTIHHNLTHLTALADRTVNHGDNYSGQLTASSGYTFPETITVKRGSVTLTPGDSTYTYDKSNGSFVIKNVTADMVVEATGELIRTPLSAVTIVIGHTDSSTTEQDIPHVGDTLTANVTAQSSSGTITATYEWFHDSFDGDPIASGQGPTYLLKASDLTHTILVRATGTDSFKGTVSSAATKAVQAKRIAVTGVTVTPGTASLIVGQKVTLTAAVTPSNATNQTVTWSSNNSSIASVDPATGEVTAVAAGTVNIVATSQDGGKTATCSVTVSEPVPGQIVASAQGVNVRYDGLHHHITVTVTTPADGYTITYAKSQNGTYSEVNPSYVDVDTYTVYYKITADGFTTLTGSAQVIISPASAAALAEAIATATAAKAGVQVIDDKTAAEVARGTRFVTTADMNALTAAIAAAETVKNGAQPTQPQLDEAKTALEAAVTRFNAAVKTGTKGSSSRPSGDSSRPTTSTEVKEDGTKVTTVTQPDGTKTETIESPDGAKEVVETKKDGTVTATTETPDGTKAVVETKPDGSKTQTVEQADGAKSEMAVTKDGAVTITATDASGEEVAKVEIPAAISAPETKFEDLGTTPWAEEAINKVAALELVKGTGDNKYDPVTPMTRGSLATVLHRLSQGKTDYQATFKDVAQGKYYTQGVAWAAKVNVVKGINDDVFAPEETITREQLAVMLARYAKLIGLSTKADAKTLDQFADGENTGAWAVDGVAWCVENGILKGKGQAGLAPTADVTRAEVAVMLDRFIALLK